MHSANSALQNFHYNSTRAITETHHLRSKETKSPLHDWRRVAVMTRNRPSFKIQKSDGLKRVLTMQTSVKTHLVRLDITEISQNRRANC